MSQLRSSPVRSSSRAVRIICIATALLAAVGFGTTASASTLSDVYQDAESDDPTDGTDSGRVESADPIAADEEEFDGRTTADTVRLVVGSLIAIAIGTALLMLMFIWHTSPRRRFRVATRRAERRRAEAASDVDGNEVAGEDDEDDEDDEADRSEDAEVRESRE